MDKYDAVRYVCQVIFFGFFCFLLGCLDILRAKDLTNC